MSATIPEIFAIIVAVLGTAGGIAALLKVNSDNAKTVTDAATDVVGILRAHVDENETRIKALEEAFSSFDSWADRVIRLMERLIEVAPTAVRTQYEGEVDLVKATRPTRRKKD